MNRTFAARDVVILSLSPSLDGAKDLNCRSWQSLLSQSMLSVRITP